MTKKELSILKSEMDYWVKDFKSQISDMEDLSPMLKEHTSNIDHNYELLQQMRSEINQLKEELAGLRLVQLLHLKNELYQEKKL
jgi:hypothetical protein